MMLGPSQWLHRILVLFEVVGLLFSVTFELNYRVKICSYMYRTVKEIAKVHKILLNEQISLKYFHKQQSGNIKWNYSIQLPVAHMQFINAVL